MNQKMVSVEKGKFKSWLIPATAILFALAALCGVAAVGSLFHPASIPAIVRDLALGQIYDPTAQLTWLVIYIVVTAVNCVGTMVLSIGIFMVLFGKHYTGMDLLYRFAEWTLKGVAISGVAVLPYFVFRAARYIYMCVSVQEGLVPLMSMLLMEGLMGAQAWILFKKLRQFLECSMDTSASIGYMLSSGNLKAPTIPSFSVTGFLVLAVFDVGIALDRFFTMLHIQKNLSVTYAFPFTSDFVQLVSGMSFAFAALGSILLCLYLRGYKRKSEQLLLHSM